MKLLKSLILLLVFTVAFTACKNEKQPEVKTVETEVTTEKTADDANATYAKAEFTIKGMTCEMGCAKTIEKKLAKMDGVKSAKVDFDKKLAMVEYDEAKVTTASLEETVKKTGESYTVQDMKTVDEFSSDDSKAEDKTKAKKDTACAADCKMECCAKEAKV